MIKNNNILLKMKKKTKKNTLFSFYLYLCTE